MQLVLLEILIAVVATRAILALIGSTAPAWPNPLWVLFAFVALVATLALIVGEVRKRFARETPPAPVPHIPLERIAPFTHDALVVRYGEGERPHIHLN